MSARLMKDGRPRSLFSIVTMTLLALLWSVPTLGLLVTSFRTREDAAGSGWWTALFNPFGTGWTTDNYRRVFENQDMGSAFLNAIVVAIPATIIPIMFAAFAAYAFTFMDFRGKDALFIAIVAVMVVPIQVAFQPLLDLLGPRGAGISGQYIAVWLLHTGFGMPLAIYTLRNYMATLPVSIVESAKIDGCSHYQIFWKLVAPMAVPAMAAFATLQFLWVWNDLLIASTFVPGGSDYAPVTAYLSYLNGALQQDNLLSAGTFVAILIPLAVFFAMQRHFARGLTAGALHE